MWRCEQTEFTAGARSSAERLTRHALLGGRGTTDAALIDEALAALLARYRSVEVDASYAAYDEHPLDEPDEWGDLASFHRAAAAS